MTPILYESHMHTPLCKHASGEPEEYAAVAESRGLKGIVVTCHNPIPGGWSADVRMAPEELDLYVDLVERARERWEGRVDVRLGMESDFVPGMEDWLAELHGRHAFHHVLGSIHPQVGEYLDRFFRGDWFEYQKLYFEHIAQAAETGLFDTMAHPDLIKNLAPDEWNLDRIWPTILHTLDRVAATGVAMELNTSGLNKRVPEMNPSLPILREMKARGIPVVIGADAHVPERVGDNYLEAIDLLESAGYGKVSFFLNRARSDLPLGDVRKSLRKSAFSA
jgi:histidinol-phosphatase (PHP family)